MNARARVWALFCCSPLLVWPQSLSVGPNDTQLSDSGVQVLAPEPVRVGRELLMHAMPVTQTPPVFFLSNGTGGRAGPFELTDGAAVGAKQNPFTLHMVDHGLRFTLHSATNAIYGPFTATNGAPVLVGGATTTLVRVPPQLQVTISHANRTAQSPSIGIAPYDAGLARSLYELRTKYAALVDRVNTDTASARLEGVPTIHSSATGNTFTPVVKTSTRDKQNANKGSELSAMTFLDKVFEQSFRIRPQAVADGGAYRFQMPPGNYVLCALQRIKDPNAASLAGSLTAVWWTTFPFDGEHPLSLALTAENAVTWREIFAFEDKR